MSSMTNRYGVGARPRSTPWGGAWRTVWRHPRLAVRQAIRGDAAGFVIAVAWLSGVAGALEALAFRGAAQPHWGPLMLFLALTMGPIFGFVYFAVAGWLVAHVGWVLGGKGGISDLRVALACGALPELIGLPLWVLVIGVYGPKIFAAGPVPTPLALSVFEGLLVVLYIWAWMLRLVTVAEAHRFSVWRSLATVVLGWLALVLAVVGIVAGVIALSGK